ncbi:MAG: transporter [Deltaproteobacteria bacterium]|nr:transporter [Deltaproteobacteria bacterium]
MSPLSSRSRSALAALLGLALLGLAARADAQACCAGAGVFAPARLKLNEDALVGMQVTGRDIIGSFGPSGAFLASPGGTTEMDLEQDLLATVRPFGNLQLGLLVPLVETRRSVPTLAETGWGIGDVALDGRYEIVPPNTSNLPGLAVIGGVSLPTGRAPEDAHSPLGTDATGLGSAQLSLGLDVERAVGRVLFDASGDLTWRFARTVGNVHEQLGLAGAFFAAAGWAFHHERALAVTASLQAERAATINGQQVPDSGRLLTTVGLSAGTPLFDNWRLQGRVYEDLPVLGKNQIAGPGIAAVVLRAW